MTIACRKAEGIGILRRVSRTRHKMMWTVRFLPTTVYGQRHEDGQSRWLDAYRTGKGALAGARDVSSQTDPTTIQFFNVILPSFDTW
jgi:hypothetical protein